jgi:hypothetical protein
MANDDSINNFKRNFYEFIKNKEEFIKYKKRQARESISFSPSEISDYLIDWYRWQYMTVDERIQNTFSDISYLPENLVNQLDYAFFEFLDNIFYALDKVEEWKKSLKKD